MARPIDIVVERDAARARISVIDRGLGIHAADQKRIFERFERAVPSNHYGGFGIGLWIVRSMVEAHGGTVQVTSTEGEGSSFVVELPIEGQAS
jgi:signal transduction histidine kinase